MKSPSPQEKKKCIYDLKLGEKADEKMLGSLKDLFEGEVKLVGISYILQDKNGTSMASTLKHKDYIEEEEE